MKPLHVGFVAEAGDNAGRYYRATVPARGLAKLGHSTWVTSAVTNKPRGPLWGVDFGRDTPREAHVIILRTWADDMSDDIEAARTNGQVVLFDVDDDVWHLPDSNAAKAVQGQPGQLDLINMKRTMDACDGILCATPAIMDVAAEVTSTPRFLARSGIDTGDFPMVERPPRDRVGWLGSMDYRADDFDLISAAINLLAEYGTEFWWLGCQDAAGFANFAERYPAIIPVHTIPWSPFSQLPLMLREVDVVVIPSVDSQFNRARSSNTGLACAASGVPFASSPLPEYAALGICPTPTDTGQWINNIRLLQRPNIRKQVAKAGRSYVLDHRRPQTMALHYETAFDAIMESRGRPKLARIK